MEGLAFRLQVFLVGKLKGDICSPQKTQNAQAHARNVFLSWPEDRAAFDKPSSHPVGSNGGT